MIWGVSVVKDEADIIEATVTHMLTQLDRLLIADNLSTDGTREILEGFDERVEIVEDLEVGHYQAVKMSHLAERAREEGARWVVPFDADELWFSREGRLGDLLASLPSDFLLAQAVLFDHVASPEGLGWRNPLPNPLRKVACRSLPELGIQQGNHEAGYRGIERCPALLDAVVVHHFPYRSLPQFLTKVRNGVRSYEATDLPPTTGAHKREFGRILAEEGERAISHLFYRRFWSDDPEADGLVHEPCL